MHKIIIKQYVGNSRTYITLCLANNQNVPSLDELLDLFKDLAIDREAVLFNHDYENCAIHFLSIYDNGDLHMTDTLKLQIMNDNFNVSKTSDVIYSLKTTKRRAMIWYQRSRLKTASFPVLTSPFNYIELYRRYEISQREKRMASTALYIEVGQWITQMITGV